MRKIIIATLGCLILLGWSLGFLSPVLHVQALTQTPTYVQSRSGQSPGSVSSLAVAFSSPVATGNLVIVATSSWNSGNTATVTKVADNFGNTYIKAVEDPTPNSVAVEPLSIWYALGVTGGSNLTVTVTTQIASNLTVAVHEYNGVAAVSALDQFQHNNLTGSPVLSGVTGVTSQANELLFGAANFQDNVNQTATAGANYTLRQQEIDNSCCEVLYTEDQTVSSTGANQASFSFARSLTYRAAIVTFRGSTTSPTMSPSPTRTMIPTGAPIATVKPTSTGTIAPTALPTLTPTATSTSATSGPVYFKIGPGFADVIPHQVIRTSDDRLYIFGAEANSPTTLAAYWTTMAGLPAQTSDFAGSITTTLNAKMISVAAAYDGVATIHVLANTLNGDLWDYPFRLSSNSFQTPTKLLTGNPLPDTSSGFWWGTSGVSALVDPSGRLQVADWAASNHIIEIGYSYNVSTNTLSVVSNPVQLDSSGSANHPALAISPLDGTLSVAWVSQATSPARILVRSKASTGSWGTIEQVSTSPVWTDTNYGLNVDQGPSFLITPDGTKRLTYIQNFDTTGSYGRIHYAQNNGSGWTDVALPSYTHDPSLAWDSGGDLYIIGHGHPNDASFGSSCTQMTQICTRKQKADGSWGIAQLYATPPAGDSFDASTSVKWSVLGFNRPETIEFAFFDAIGGSYFNTTIYYGRLGSSSPPPTFAAVSGSSIPTMTPTASPSATPTMTSTPSIALSATPTPTMSPVGTVTATSTATITPTPIFQNSLASGNFNAWSAHGATGSGAAATVSSACDVDGDGHGGHFVITGRTNGQAFTKENVTWPASGILAASGTLKVNTTAYTGGTVNVLDLHLDAPLYQAVAVVQVANGQWNLTVRNRSTTSTSIVLLPQLSANTSYTVRLSYDLTGAQPVAKVWINGVLAASYTDGTTGTTYAPTSVLYEAYETNWTQAMDLCWDVALIAASAP